MEVLKNLGIYLKFFSQRILLKKKSVLLSQSRPIDENLYSTKVLELKYKDEKIQIHSINKLTLYISFCSNP